MISLALVFALLLSALALPVIAADTDYGSIRVSGAKKDGSLYLLDKGKTATLIALDSHGREYRIPKGGYAQWVCVGQFGFVKMKVSSSGTRCDITGSRHGYAYVGVLIMNAKGEPVGGCGDYVNVQKDGLCKKTDKSLDSHYVGFLIFDTLIQTPTDLLDFFTGQFNLGTRMEYAIFGKYAK